jgi:transposase
MQQVSRIGMDKSKQIFQLHGVDAAEEPVLRKKLRRKEMIKFFDGLPPTQVGIEACASSHHWARLLQSFGHEVKPIPPQFVKPYVKRNKNDAADADTREESSWPPPAAIPLQSPSCGASTGCSRSGRVG